MSLELFNTLTRKKEELNPIKDGEVGLYTCGPTVYNFAHIGNLRTYIFEDILERVLKYDGYKVKRVMNITDVSHMTNDSDVGDDKMDKAARTQGKTVQEIAEVYADAFWGDLKKLNIEKPETIAWATKFVPDQTQLIQALFDKGYAYDTRAAVYFDVAKFKDYGKLSGQSLAEKITGARGEVIVDKEKHNAADFALWFKLVGKFKNHLLHWPSPWGEGFPGWHIECSAISRHFLGQPFDIHTGGVDHIGTHHENEIAQSEAAYGVPLANIWMHGEHLIINDAKMAKSEGNFITLSELEKKGYPPLVYRYFVLQAHYRTQLNFTWEALDAAEKGLNRIYQSISLQARYKLNNMGKNPKMTLNQYEEQFHEALNDDLGIPKALVILEEMLTDHNNAEEKFKLLKKFGQVLGLKFDIPLNYIPDEEIKMEAEQHQKLVQEKRFDDADKIRDKAKQKYLTMGTMATLLDNSSTSEQITYVVPDFFPHNRGEVD